MDAEFFKYLGSMGTGGALAGLIFLAYRKDATKWAQQEAARAQVEAARADAVMNALVGNAKALTELTTYLRNGHSK